MPVSPNDSLQKTFSYTIKVNNKELDTKYQVLNIHVWQEVYKIGRARISIIAGNSYLNTFEESEVADFAPGKDVEISLGYDQTNAVVFKGLVLKHRIDIREGYLNLASRSLLVLECSDKAIKMTLGRKTALYEDKLDSEVITTLISTSGVDKTVEATTLKHPFLTQYDISDWDFMIKRAKANGMVVLNVNNKLTVKAPAVTGSGVVSVKQGDDVTSFRGEIDASTQWQAVKSVSWDPHTEADKNSTGAEPSNLSKPGDKVGKTLGAVASPATLEFGVKTPMDTTELKDLADALLLESRLRRVVGEVSFKGVNTVIPGCIISLEGFGSLFDGDAYVTSVHHSVEDGYYSTTAGFGLPEQLSVERLDERPNSWMGPVSGLHIGIVKKLDGDPLTQYRIKVMIPSIKSTGEGVWARISQFYATNNAGSFFVPELNSEVIVGFLNDDPRYPVILGCLYDSKNKPNETLTKENSIKSILSKEKLTISFDDKEKILTLSTPGKNKIVISDKAKGLTIEDQHGNKIETKEDGITITSKKKITFDGKDEIEIKAAKAITIKSTGDSVKLDGKSVEVSSKGNFKVTASSGAEIKASGTVNIKGSMVNVN
jgi:Rhs element Vgr protein